MANDDMPAPEVLAELGITPQQWQDELVAARQRGQADYRDETRIAAAYYQQATDRIVIELAGGMVISVPRSNLQALAGVGPADLTDVQVPAAHMLCFPKVDRQIYLPDLLRGIMGSRHWMAQQLGQAKSEAKAAAARQNGKKGGRPRKDKSRKPA